MYRKGVSALIINSKNEFLLVNLISFEEKYFAIPGGGVEEGESLKDAVYREIKEELNINHSSLELIGVSNDSLKTTFKTPKISKQGITYIGSERFFFAFRFTGSDDEIQLTEDEVRMCKWVPFANLGQYLLFDNQLEDTVNKIKEILHDIF